MFPCMFDGEQHEIIPSEIGRWCIRNAPADWRDRLFTYRHRLHGTFVVAVWADKDRRHNIFSDVVNLGLGWGGFSHAMADEMMRRMWAPMSPTSMATEINQQDRNYHSMQQDKQQERQEHNAKRKEVWK